METDNNPVVSEEDIKSISSRVETKMILHHDEVHKRNEAHKLSNEEKLNSMDDKRVMLSQETA